MKNYEVAEIVREVQKHGKNAFGKLYEKTWKIAYYYCYKQIGNEADAEDVTQEIMIKTYNAISKLYEPEMFNAMFNKIMHDVCIDFMRKKKRIVPTKEDDFEESANDYTEENEEFLPEEVLEKKELRDKITSVVDELPQKQKEAILLFYFNEMSQQEISDVTGSSVNAVNNRLVSARKTLKTYIENMIKKGVLSYTMAIIPIMTKVLEEEHIFIARPEVGEQIWEGVAKSLGIVAVATTAVTETTKTASFSAKAVAKSNAFMYAAIATALTAAVVVGTMTGMEIYNGVQQELPAVTQKDITQTTIAVEDVIEALKKANNKEQFDSVINKYVFAHIKWQKTDLNIVYNMYYKDYQDKKIAVCEKIEEGDNFSIKYAVFEKSYKIPNDLENWFNEN